MPGKAELPSPQDIVARVREALGQASRVPEALPGVTADQLLSFTRSRLLDVARMVGITGRHRLKKAALAAAVERWLRSVGMSSAPARRRVRPTAKRATPVAVPASSKATAGPVVVRPAPDVLASGRLTAMTVDPDRLYCFWDVHWARVAERRTALGDDVPLVLRVHDVTGRLFDGTNAHRFDDVVVADDERQRFIHVGRPGSSAIVELGLRAPDGRWVRLVRARRCDFPRRDPVTGDLHWMRVDVAPGAGGSAAWTTTPVGGLAAVAAVDPVWIRGGASERGAAESEIVRGGASEAFVRRA